MFHAFGSLELSVAPYLLIIVTALAASVLVLAWVAAADSSRETWLVRAVQSVRLSRTRMGRMLRRRRIGLVDYARGLSVPEIRRQVEACRTCDQPELCDRALGSGGPTRSTFSFCPNRPAIERHLGSRAPGEG